MPLPPHLALVVVDSGVSRRLESSKYGDRRRELEAGHPARVRHVETENARVREVVAILREPGQPRLAELGRLFADGHASLRDDFEVTIPELDRSSSSPRDAARVAARMTGGGFGGSIVALVEQERADAVARESLREYRQRYGDEVARRTSARPRTDATSCEERLLQRRASCSSGNGSPCEGTTRSASSSSRRRRHAR